MTRDEASDAALSACIRRTIAHAFQTGDPSALTLRLVREMVEKEMGLKENFLKTDEFWGAESKRIVKEEVDIQTANMEAHQQPSSSPEVPKAAPKKRKAPATATTKAAPAKKTKKKATPPKSAATVSDDGEDGDEVPKPKKRAQKKTAKSESVSPAASPKRTKTVSVSPAASPKKVAKKPARGRGKKVVDDDDDDEDEVLSDLDEEPVKEEKKKDTSPPPSDLPSDDETANKDEKKDSNGAASGDKSESELSELEDGPPIRKKRAPKSTGTKAKAAPKPKNAATEKAPSNLSPSEEKIANLQKQLVKCGIRRIWKKELAHCTTAGEKISHLSGMLRDAGLVGQFSESKAKKIKEDRELRADIEAIQQGEERWGMSATGRPKRGTAAAAGRSAGRRVADSDDEEEESQGEDGKPKRRLARGLKEDLAFLGDQSSDSD